MEEETIPVLLVTANVGSIFEDPSVMLKIWAEEFLSTVSRLDPKFVALHCQEVGGKTYEQSMKHVEYFVRLLMSSEELRLFDRVRVYLDEDYSSAENFTALGNFYFIHESVSDVLLWDFTDMKFVTVDSKEVHSGNIEAVTTKEKAKFPQDLFPECKWSRKGFLRTRWSLGGSVLDLVNIHLFHDASNLVAMETFPSVYCRNRRRALEHTLDRFQADCHGAAPFFVFGDFNFRTDTLGVVQKLGEGMDAVRLQGNKNSDHTKLQYRDSSSEVVLSLGKKEFSHREHQTIFTGDWLRQFDRELEGFSGRLFEFPLTFSPSYPYEEELDGARRYMLTRCPAWCDRVLLGGAATELVSEMSSPDSVEYGVIGAETCMGDHKPVFLRLELRPDSGTVVMPAALPRLSLQTLALNEAHLMPPPRPHHDPYTPESCDTPSPCPSPVPPLSGEEPQSSGARLEPHLQSSSADARLFDNLTLRFNPTEHNFEPLEDFKDRFKAALDGSQPVDNLREPSDRLESQTNSTITLETLQSRLDPLGILEQAILEPVSSSIEPSEARSEPLENSINWLEPLDVLPILIETKLNISKCLHSQLDPLNLDILKGKLDFVEGPVLSEPRQVGSDPLKDLSIRTEPVWKPSARYHLRSRLDPLEEPMDAVESKALARKDSLQAIADLTKDRSNRCCCSLQ